MFSLSFSGELLGIMFDSRVFNYLVVILYLFSERV